MLWGTAERVCYPRVCGPFLEKLVQTPMWRISPALNCRTSCVIHRLLIWPRNYLTLVISLSMLVYFSSGMWNSCCWEEEKKDNNRLIRMEHYLCFVFLHQTPHWPVMPPQWYGTRSKMRMTTTTVFSNDVMGCTCCHHWDQIVCMTNLIHLQGA